MAVFVPNDVLSTIGGYKFCGMVPNEGIPPNRQNFTAIQYLN